MSVEELTTVSQALPFIAATSLFNESAVFNRCIGLSTIRAGDVTLGVVYLTLGLLGAAENFYIFYQIRKTAHFRQSQSRGSFFMLVGNLATSDVMMLCYPMWVTVHSMFNGRLILQQGYHAFIGTVFFVHSASARVSIIFIMFIAVFRVFSIRSPLNVARVFSMRRTGVLCALSWLLVFILTTYSFEGNINNAVYSNISAITMVLLGKKENIALSVAGQILLPFLLPGLVTFGALLYLLGFLSRIYSRKISTYRQNASSYRPSRERDSIITTVKLIICFILSYTPWYIEGVLEIFGSGQRDDPNIASRAHIVLNYSNCFASMYWRHLALGGLLFCSAAINPFLYGRTLTHTAQQNAQQGLVQALFSSAVSTYRKARTSQIPSGFIKLRIRSDLPDATPPKALRSTSRMLPPQSSESCNSDDVIPDPRQAVSSSNSESLQGSTNLYPVSANT